MWFDKIRESMSSKKTSSSSSVNLEVSLPKLNFDYRLNLDLYLMDKLIVEIFTDLSNEGFYC
jgi:hypothetical protein